jgi:hypothetical protein
MPLIMSEHPLCRNTSGFSACKMFNDALKQITVSKKNSLWGYMGNMFYGNKNLTGN